MSVPTDIDAYLGNSKECTHVQYPYIAMLPDSSKPLVEWNHNWSMQGNCILSWKWHLLGHRSGHISACAIYYHMNSVPKARNF